MWLIIGLLALPLIEIALFVVIGGKIGLWLTLGWVVLSALIGVMVLKWVARFGPISFDRDVQAIRDPKSPIARRALTILAGIFLILPGFFTDMLGLLLLLMPVQSLIIKAATRWSGQDDVMPESDMTIDGSWTEVAPEESVSTKGVSPPPAGPTRH